MDKSVVKALVMALISPVGIGGTLNDASFRNLDINAQRIVDHCMGEKNEVAKKGSS